jgi:hypothetical protein
VEFESYPLKKLFTGVILVAVVVNSSFFFSSYWSVHPNGSDEGLWLVLPLVFLAVASLAIGVGALLCLPFANLRKKAFLILVASLIWFGSALMSEKGGESMRIHAFRELAQRSSPIVEAIKNYELTNGAPPNTLEELVPQHLSALPSTGIKAYPYYELYLPKSKADIDGNPWMLFVNTPSGGINFDMLIYLPRENYPDTGYGGWLEPVDHWAYVHE